MTKTRKNRKPKSMCEGCRKELEPEWKGLLEDLAKLGGPIRSGFKCKEYKYNGRGKK